MKIIQYYNLKNINLKGCKNKKDLIYKIKNYIR